MQLSMMLMDTAARLDLVLIYITSTSVHSGSWLMPSTLRICLLPFPAGGAASNVPEAAAGSPGQVRLLLQVILPEEEIAAAATRCSPISSAAQSSASARYVPPSSCSNKQSKH